MEKKWLLTKLNMGEAAPAGSRGENKIFNPEVTQLSLHKRQVLSLVRLKENLR
jgi:hypothetical protein